DGSGGRCSARVTAGGGASSLGRCGTTTGHLRRGIDRALRPVLDPDLVVQARGGAGCAGSELGAAGCRAGVWVMMVVHRRGGLARAEWLVCAVAGGASEYRAARTRRRARPGRGGGRGRAAGAGAG